MFINHFHALFLICVTGFNINISMWSNARRSAKRRCNTYRLYYWREKFLIFFHDVNLEFLASESENYTYGIKFRVQVLKCLYISYEWLLKFTYFYLQNLQMKNMENKKKIKSWLKKGLKGYSNWNLVLTVLYCYLFMYFFLSSSGTKPI